MIDYLIHERADQEEIAVPADEAARKQLLRALMNIRMPKPVSKEFLTVQDAYLQQESRQKGKRQPKLHNRKSRIRKKICILKLCGTRNSEEMYNIS